MRKARLRRVCRSEGRRRAWIAWIASRHHSHQRTGAAAEETSADDKGNEAFLLVHLAECFKMARLAWSANPGSRSGCEHDGGGPLFGGANKSTMVRIRNSELSHQCMFGVQCIYGSTNATIPSPCVACLTFAPQHHANQIAERPIPTLAIPGWRGWTGKAENLLRQSCNES